MNYAVHVCLRACMHAHMLQLTQLEQRLDTFLSCFIIQLVCGEIVFCSLTQLIVMQIYTVLACDMFVLVAWSP